MWQIRVLVSMADFKEGKETTDGPAVEVRMLTYCACNLYWGDCYRLCIRAQTMNPDPDTTTMH